MNVSMTGFFLLGFFLVVEQNLDYLVRRLDNSGMKLCTTWAAMIKDALKAPGEAVYCCGICSSMAVASSGAGGAMALPIFYDNNDIRRSTVGNLHFFSILKERKFDPRLGNLFL